MAGWAARCGRNAVGVSVRRVRNLGRLALLGSAVAKAELARVMRSPSGSDYVSRRGKDLLATARRTARSTVDVYRALQGYAQRNPAEAATRIALFCFGFRVGSGGLDGNGGIPDLDWLMGDHRSLLTHSVLPGVAVEIAAVALADLVSTIHANLPELHDTLWDVIRDRADSVNTLALGVSSGLAYHLLVDATLDGGGVYQDIPVPLSHAEHQGIAAGFGIIEGADSVARSPRQEARAARQDGDSEASPQLIDLADAKPITAADEKGQG